MAKDKDENPLAERSSYEEALGAEAGQVKRKIRRASPANGEGLLTSQDLFGDIIQDFDGESPAPPAAGATPPETPEAPEPPELEPTDTSGSIETARLSRESIEPPEVKSRFGQAKVRSDTLPLEKAPGHESDEYSLVDLAYSTLLQDVKLNQVIEEIGQEEAESGGGDPGTDYGQYLLLDLIAMGGMAEVFRAKRKGVEGFEKVVAVKRILPHLSQNKGFVEMFIDEAKMVAGLSHPNIVQIFELGKLGETYFIAMEYVEGMDLRTILTQAREKEMVPDVDLVAMVTARVASALEYAHRHRDSEGRDLRIVHRDVSPQNILISTEGEVKLVDFGIAKAAIKASHTDSGSLRGKLLYMSPEQAWGKTIDNRSDIFSLGVVLFEALTGRCLFSGDSEMSILERVREARVIPPSSMNPAVPIELEAVVTRALRKEPEERYQDASEMLLHLDSYLRRRPAVGPADLARFVKTHFDGGKVPAR